MNACPACARVAFDGARCAACGFAVVAGKAVAPGAPAEPGTGETLEGLLGSALDGGQDVEVEPLEGLEGTALEPRAPRLQKAKDESGEGGKGDFAYAACPRCQAQQPTPAPTFCEACGTRLKFKARVDEGAHDRRCTDCGVRNGGDRSTCKNCGARLS